jgi:basic membrane lipoprotein Med (substrate-binding protein (PBP1-ABC) superfamily)
VGSFLFAAVGAAQPCLVVGIVYGGPITDAGYNQAHYDAIRQLQVNMPCVRVIQAEMVGAGDVEAVIEMMIAQGARLIIPASFGFQTAAFNVSQRHPGVVFLHPGGFRLSANFGTYFGTPQQGMYLLGAAAAMMTRTGKLGFVGGLPIGFVLGNANGFHLGARSVNPNIQTYVVFTGSWVDRAKEVAATNALIQQGCDVIAMHVDSPQAIVQVAEAAGVYSIGYQNLAAQNFAPRGWITGLGFTFGGLFTETAQQVIAGTWTPAHRRKGFADGYMALAPFGPAVPMTVQQHVLGLLEQLNAGTLQPFAGPIKDQAGVVRIPAGEVWGNEKMGLFDWFVEGIIGAPR